MLWYEVYDPQYEMLIEYDEWERRGDGYTDEHYDEVEADGAL